MYLGKKAKNPRSFQLMVDLFHIVICLIIVLLAIYIFLDPTGHQEFYAVIFFLASILNFVAAVSKFRRDNTRKNQKLSGVFFFCIGVALLLLALVSAISIWRFSF